MRLTEKEIDNGKTFYVSDNDVKRGEITATEKYWKVISKLGQLEDIEEELGISLITFMKVRYAYFKEEIVYIRRKNKLISGTIKYIGEKTIWVSYYNKQNFTYPVATLKLKDYNKTWALTREELE